MKGTIRTFLLLFVVIFAVAVVYYGVRADSGSSDAEQLLHEVTIEAEVLENGDLRVSERWDLALFDRGRSYRNLYKTFPGSREQEVKDFTVTDNETGEVYAAQGTFGSLRDTQETAETSYIVASRSETELGWYIPPTNEGEVSYTLSYTVTNAVERYDDVGVLYYGFIGSEFTIPIESFTAAVTLPDGAAQDELRGWLHCTAESYLTIESGSRVTMTAQDVPAETFIETRICAPSSLFPDAVRKNLIHKPVFFRFLGGHEEIALHIRFDLFERIARCRCEDFRENVVQTVRLADRQLHVLDFPLGSAGDGMDHDPGVRERIAFSRRARAEQNRAHAGRLPDAVGLDIAGEHLHHVVDRQSGGDASPGGADVHVDVLLGILALKKQQFGNHKIRDGIVDRGTEQDDSVFQKTGVDVISAFPVAGLFHHHGDGH